MTTYWAHNHQCATCEYWNGPRNLKTDSRVVEANSGSTGICMGTNRIYRGKEVRPGTKIGGGYCYCRWYCLTE